MAKTTGNKKKATKPGVLGKELEKMAKEATVNGEEVIQLTKADFEKVRAHIESVQKEKEETDAASKKAQKSLEKLQSQLDILQSEKDEAVAIAQRLHADFDNYRKRNAAVRTDSLEEGKRECMSELLPVLDNFERALESADGVDESFVEGVRLLQRLLLDILGKLGMEEIPAEGEFDPNLHNAVIQESVKGKKHGEILEVLQKGYRVQDKVLRYSMVKVAE